FGYYAFLHGPYDGSVETAPIGQQVVMCSVAALLVFFGLVPDALFALLPGHGAEEFHTFTLSHIAEGVALALLGLVGFAVLKRPLSKVGRVPDIDAVYNPLAFYGTRALVHGITESYAAVDRGAVALADRAASLRAAPGISRFRANIGQSIFLLMVVLAGVLAALGVL
ncbi:MAG: Na(+)/H(+) antiporter subunit D, partial [Haloferacaceae archaeon]